MTRDDLEIILGCLVVWLVGLALFTLMHSFIELDWDMPWHWERPGRIVIAAWTTAVTVLGIMGLVGERMGK